MKKMLVLFICLSLQKSSPAQAKEFRYDNQWVTYTFTNYEKDSSAKEMVALVDSLLVRVKNDILPIGSKVKKQVTINSILSYEINGKQIAYKKTFIIGILKGSPLTIFFAEEYPTKVGAVFEDKNSLLLMKAINRFLLSLIRSYDLMPDTEKNKEEIDKSSRISIGAGLVFCLSRDYFCSHDFIRKSWNTKSLTYQLCK